MKIPVVFLESQFFNLEKCSKKSLDVKWGSNSENFLQCKVLPGSSAFELLFCFFSFFGNEEITREKCCKKLRITSQAFGLSARELSEAKFFGNVNGTEIDGNLVSIKTKKRGRNSQIDVNFASFFGETENFQFVEDWELLFTLKNSRSQFLYCLSERWKKTRQAKENGFFYLSIDDACRLLSIGSSRIDNIKRSLKSAFLELNLGGKLKDITFCDGKVLFWYSNSSKNVGENQTKSLQLELFSGENTGKNTASRGDVIGNENFSIDTTQTQLGEISVGNAGENLAQMAKNDEKIVDHKPLENNNFCQVFPNGEEIVTEIETKNETTALETDFDENLSAEENTRFGQFFEKMSQWGDFCKSMSSVWEEENQNFAVEDELLQGENENIAPVVESTPTLETDFLSLLLFLSLGENDSKEVEIGTVAHYESTFEKRNHEHQKEVDRLMRKVAQLEENNQQLGSQLSEKESELHRERNKTNRFETVRIERKELPKAEYPYPHHTTEQKQQYGKMSRFERSLYRSAMEWISENEELRGDGWHEKENNHPPKQLANHFISTYVAYEQAKSKKKKSAKRPIGWIRTGFRKGRDICLPKDEHMETNVAIDIEEKDKSSALFDMDKIIGGSQSDHFGLLHWTIDQSGTTNPRTVLTDMCIYIADKNKLDNRVIANLYGYLDGERLYKMPWSIDVRNWLHEQEEIAKSIDKKQKEDQAAKVAKQQQSEELEKTAKKKVVAAYTPEQIAAEEKAAEEYDPTQLYGEAVEKLKWQKKTVEECNNLIKSAQEQPKNENFSDSSAIAE